MGSLCMNTGDYSVTKDGEKIELTAKEFEILSLADMMIMGTRLFSRIRLITSIPFAFGIIRSSNEGRRKNRTDGKGIWNIEAPYGKPEKGVYQGTDLFTNMEGRLSGRHFPEYPLTSGLFLSAFSPSPAAAENAGKKWQTKELRWYLSKQTKLQTTILQSLFLLRRFWQGLKQTSVGVRNMPERRNGKSG